MVSCAGRIDSASVIRRGGNALFVAEPLRPRGPIHAARRWLRAYRSTAASRSPQAAAGRKPGKPARLITCKATHPSWVSHDLVYRYYLITFSRVVTRLKGTRVPAATLPGLPLRGRLLGVIARSAIGWILPIAIILLWEAGARVGLISSAVLPAPSAVLAAFWRLLLSGELVHNIWTSTWRAFAGFAIGGVIGFALGIANGASRLSRDVTDTTLQIVRNIPHLALIPLVILWFGIGEEAKLSLHAAAGQMRPAASLRAARSFSGSWS